MFVLHTRLAQVLRDPVGSPAPQPTPALGGPVSATPLHDRLARRQSPPVPAMIPPAPPPFSLLARIAAVKKASRC